MGAVQAGEPMAVTEEGAAFPQGGAVFSCRLCVIDMSGAQSFAHSMSDGDELWGVTDV